MWMKDAVAVQSRLAVAPTPLSVWPLQFFESGEHAAPKFVSNIETNTKRYLALFTNAASEMLPHPNR